MRSRQHEGSVLPDSRRVQREAARGRFCVRFPAFSMIRMRGTPLSALLAQRAWPERRMRARSARLRAARPSANRHRGTSWNLRKAAEFNGPKVKQSSRRDRGNRERWKRFGALKSDMDPVRASPCRPAATINAPHRTGRTHESARPNAWCWTRNDSESQGGVNTRRPCRRR